MNGRIGLQIIFWPAISLLLIALPVRAEKPCLPVSFFPQASEIFCLEVADTYASREKGLQNRLNLPKRGGMIFVFPENAPRVFWMQNTMLELDFLFLDDDGVVQNLVTHVQPGAIKIYGSARYVIELPGGVGEALAIWPGDQALFAKEGLQTEP